MKKFTTVFLLAFIAVVVNAQRFTKEMPPSFAYEQIAKAKLKSAKKLTIPFDVQVLKAEDVKNEKLGFPIRVAKNIDVDLTPENAGEWFVLPDGQRIWRLEIEAPGANAISLLYDKFIIPEGGKLFIYSTDYKLINVFTNLDNPKREEYSTDFIPGDKIRLEYAEPASAEQLEINKSAIPQMDAFLTKEEKMQEKKAKSQLPLSFVNSETQELLQIKITGISYAYKDVLACIFRTFQDIYDNVEIRTPDELGHSGACEVNINNTEGEKWYHQKKGIAATLQILDDGAYICSGTVVNNVLEDRTPYFLMAYHCGGYATDAQFNQWRFYFHWERTGADDSSPLAEYKLLTGATKKVAININNGSDGLLLQLNSPIPADWDVFYNGWDRRNTATAGGVSIHHPAGDVKKISTYTETPSSYTWNGSGAIGATNAHWKLTFTATEHGHGVTEGGSSGAPLFNTAGRVIGTLTGGNSNCTNTSGINLYGKLAWHWDQSSDPDQKMSSFLDPNNMDVEYIDGTYGNAYSVSFTASKTNITASEEITFTNQSYGDIDSYAWSFTGGYPTAHNGENPPAVLYLTPGNYIAKLTAKKAGETVGELEVPIEVTLKQNYCLEDNPIEIGNGTSASPYPLGMDANSTRNVLSAAIYTAGELNMTEGSLINDIEWTADAAVSTARSLYIYLKEIDETSFNAATTWADEIEDATLAYQSNATWTNAAGANKITLTTPFKYSGTKNLKVLVRVSSTSEASISSQCRYTVFGTNTHQQWGNTNATLPAETGILNANRPNIKFYYSAPCGVDTPTADFIATKETVLIKEGFDNTPFPSTGWTIEKPGASSHQWQAGNPSSNNFKTIDPDSKYSAVIAYDESAIVDSWLKSSAVTIDNTDSKIEFYVLYSGSWLAGGATTFYISDDEGANWASKWTTGTTNDSSLPSAWRKQEIDLSEYAGKTILFAWQYYGQDGDLAGIDGIKVSFPNTEGKAVIYEGDFINFIDRSTGPVVTWNWTLPGGIPSTSNLSDPEVQYIDAGVYDAKLFVKNNIGTGEKTIREAVTVQARIPVPQFVSYSDGFIKQADFGPFLPLTGGTVAFEHSTLYYPKTITWSFPGADPSSSVDEYPEVKYPEGEAKYNVTLEVANSAGTGSEAKPDYVQIGGTAGVWNVRAEENPIYRYTSSGAGVTGADIFAQTAERFEAPAAGEISQIRVYTSDVTQDASSYLTLAVYSDMGGVPGTAISPVLQIQGGDNRIMNGGYNTLVFPNPIPVSGAFHVVVGSTDYNSTFFTVPCVENRPDGYNTVSAYFGDTWLNLTDIFALYTSMNIIPEFTYTTAELVAPVLYNKKNTDTTAETIEFTTTGSSWTAFASDDWIRLSEAEGSVNETGKGALSFTVSDNTVQNIRKGNIKLNVAGHEFKIYVVQSGIAPENITAAYNDEKTAVNVAWEHEVLHSKQNRTIVDVTESDVLLTKRTPSNENHLVKLKHRHGVEAVVIASLPVVEEAFVSTEESEETLQWHDESPAYIYGHPNGGNLEVAVRFAPEDLLFYNGATIKAVEIYTYRPATNVKVNIRKGNQIIHTQDIGDITENLKQQRIELTTPVVIDASEDLYVGYEFDQVAGDAQTVYVPVADAGTAVAGKGDLFSYAGDPFSSTGIGDWLITTYVEPVPLEMAFNLYKNGTLLAEGLIEKSYVDTETPPVNEKARYTVTAIYGKPELESTASAPATIYAPITITTEDPLEFCESEKATLQTVDEEGYLYQWYQDNNLIEGANADNYAATESGVYTVQVTSDEGTELSLLEPVTVTVLERPITPSVSVIYVGDGIAAFVVNNPQEGVSYQWYLGSEAIGEPVTSNVYTAYETGTYSVIAINGETGCSSDPGGGIAVTIVLINDLFSVPTDPVYFAGSGDKKEIALMFSDPENYISALGFNLHTNAPDWITVTVEGNTMIFEANVNETDTFRSDTVQVWYGLPNSSFDLNNGYKIGVYQKALQNIVFETPEILNLQDETYLLSATATSGLDVSFSLRETDRAYAEIQEGNILRLKQAGEIIVSASVAGNDEFEEKKDVSKKISIRTKTGMELISKGKLTVYPNPAYANHIFCVASGLSETELYGAFIDVYNLSGTLILRQEATGKITEISLPVQGTYLLRLKGEEIMMIIK
ncbi:MAG: choice-of-anchor J domain-containing protein [Dysgonamonadaceae bacterium]|jgi:PKD repeat protein|nr:choice-of-anchor J domain-containing protein [Dysgonamonadaceae bacterium]